MEKEEIAYILYEVRKKLVNLAIIFIFSTSLFFIFAGFLVNWIVSDLYPAEAVLQSKERLIEVSEELERISEVLRNFTLNPTEENKTQAISAARDLTRLAMDVSTSPILQSPLEALLLYLKMSMVVGTLFCSIYLLKVVYSALKSRGLNLNIKKSSAAKYAAVSLVLFFLGLLYGYNMVKLFLKFLYNLAVSQGAVPLYSLSEFVSFVFLMVFVFGMVFELPLILFFLVKNNLVQYKTLLYYRRHLYVLFFVIGAVVTPPDVFTQLMVAVPMILFFEISLLFIRITIRNS
ncbi:MAG: twin-arginine translocase subunit TatC [Archaeoglobales archaeon]|nr:twin-arginine translocase subunit TatC [Archaeoglobales archaeon]